jgi:redox-sensitive bicupin YhaK (pirin superfamily)
MTMKTVIGTFGNNERHWVGDGFPVRSLFSYHDFGSEISPFLLLDYGGPHEFAPAQEPRGVGTHPHRGFETVTIVYDGEVEHRDSTGAGGIIKPGDVQWMTAGAGILHNEFHSEKFTQTGGTFRMVQLWVNLPAKAKKVAGGYQALIATDIPTVTLPNGGGKLRIIAGEYAGAHGPARTYTPVNVWDGHLMGETEFSLALPEGHVAMLVVLNGLITVNDGKQADEAEMVLLTSEGHDAKIKVRRDTTLLVLTGLPIEEPIVGHGPFVMNTQNEIAQAVADFRSGRFGKLAA